MIEATESNKIANRLQEVDKDSRMYKKLYKKIDKVLSNEINKEAISGQFKCFMSISCLSAFVYAVNIFTNKQKREESIFLTVVNDYIEELESKGYRVDFPKDYNSFFYIYWD